MSECPAINTKKKKTINKNDDDDDDDDGSGGSKCVDGTRPQTGPESTACWSRSRKWPWLIGLVPNRACVDDQSGTKRRQGKGAKANATGMAGARQ